MYKYYGDIQILQTYYDGIAEYVDFLQRNVDQATGLVTYASYGDW